MAIDKLLSGLPSRSMSQAAFDAATEQFMADLPVLAEQMNETAAGMNAAAAGGVFSIPYTFKRTGGYGGGNVDSNNATLSSATLLYTDNTSAAGAAVATAIANAAVSTSTIKGRVKLQKVGAPNVFMIFNITAFANGGSYGTFTVAHVASSSNNPFNANDSVVAYFERTGDAGNFVPGYMRVSDRRASGVGTSAPFVGVNTRVLNTVDVNTISGASLASNTVTLPAGTYEFEGRCPATSVVQHQALLFDNSASSYIAVGSSERAGQSLDNSSNSFVRHRVVIGATTTFQLRHYIANISAGSPDLGRVTTSTYGELYAELLIMKVA